MDLKKLYNWFMSWGITKAMCKNSTIAKLLSWEVLSYLVFGVLTTVVSFVTYFIFDKSFTAISGSTLKEAQLFTLVIQFTMETVANIVAWIAAVIFAFITNKIYVFESRARDIKTVTRELLSFVSGRLLTLVLFETLLFALLCDKLSLNGYIAKALVSILVIIFNYVFSKLIVFRNKKKSEGDKS